MPNNSSKYLNIEIPENHNFSDNQKELLCVAFERVGQFVQIDKTGSIDANRVCTRCKYVRRALFLY